MKLHVRLVCDECGDFLRSFDSEDSISTSLTLKVPQCDYCRDRAVEAAYDEGREAGMEAATN